MIEELFYKHLITAFTHTDIYAHTGTDINTYTHTHSHTHSVDQAHMMWYHMTAYTAC